jgi:hypothetical protein
LTAAFGSITSAYVTYSDNAPSVSVPSGAAAGDVFIWVVKKGNGEIITPPTGFYALDSAEETSIGSGIYTFAKTADGTESGNFTGSSSAYSSWICLCWVTTGVSSTIVSHNANDTYAGYVSSVPCSTGSIASSSGDFIVGVFSATDAGTTSTLSFVPPSGFTTENIGGSPILDLGNSRGVALAYKTSPGETAAYTADINSTATTTFSGMGAGFVFTPSGGGGGTSVALTGQSSTAGQGTLSVAGSANKSLTGQQITSSIGTITVSGSAAVTITGQQADTGQGNLVVTGSANAVLTGQASTLGQGGLSVAGSAALTLSGLEITSGQGTVSVSVSGSVTVNLTGQQLSVSQGSLSISGDASVTLTGIGINSQQGSLTISGDSTLALSGQALSSIQGALALTTSSSVALTGQQITIGQGIITISTPGAFVTGTKIYLCDTIYKDYIATSNVNTYICDVENKQYTGTYTSRTYGAT